jgi:hypothetical protein
MSYTVTSLVEDLRASYGAGASNEAVALIIAARNRGLSKERDIFTAAAILLCRPSSGMPPAAIA